MDVDEIRPITSVAPLQFPVHFVSETGNRWADVIDALEPGQGLDHVPDRVVTHEDITIIQTYVNLRRAGLDVTLTDHVVPHAVNVASSIDLGVRHHSADAFVVSFRADWSRPYLADITLTMNGSVATRRTEHAMPHWVQTGLVPRDPSRGDRLEHLVFKGDMVNLDPRFATDDFAKALAGFGVSFRAQPYDRETKRSGWHDYTEVDAVLAVRAIPPTELVTKPATKLINAWAAGVPAVLGVEPAFREVRRSPLDYIEVVEPAQAIDAIRRLATDTAYYREMVDNGTTRAADYTNQRIVERWRALLEGPVQQEFQRWEARPRARRRAAMVVRDVAHKAAEKVFERRQSTRV